MQFDIATGKSRRETRWKNTKVTWEQLVERFREPVRTHLTYAEYMSSPKGDQDNIKDVGGFIGGYVKDGKRTAANIVHRQIICLDIDHATDPEKIWTIKRRAAIYSTHKHSPEKPRLRLIVPLDRPVSAEEYEAIARMVASKIGIEIFDDTTYQANRLMYWPACAKDGAFYFKEFPGECLEADLILAYYADWTDRSSWPTSSREGVVINRSLNKQQDPLAKKNVVGAFCRTYSISGAIAAFLSDVYEPGTQGRYSFKSGSTANGVVIYEDKFSYSHHETDPAGGQLCNAWDLVRIHRFSELDAEAAPQTRADRLPSFVAMHELALAQEDVKADLITFRRDQALEAFAEVEIKESAISWETQLQVDLKGNIYPTIDNILIILRNDSQLQGLGRFNDFTQRVDVDGVLPWTRTSPHWTDADDEGLTHYLEKVYNLYNPGKMHTAVDLMHQAAHYHPVKDYLQGLQWDGVKRLDTVLIDYLGAEDCHYTRAVTRKTLIGAVARIMQPGCKFDNMLTLVGPQGAGKSTLIAKLGRGWSSDTLISVTGKEAYEALHGVWIMEMSELTATRRADVESVKQFISKREDLYRKAYDRRVSVNPRSNIFIGTTNEWEFLRDSTGNRRYWVVEVTTESQLDLFDDMTDEVIDQIWAEAVLGYHLGEDLYLNTEESVILAGQQKGHEEVSPWQSAIEDFLAIRLPAAWPEMDLYARRMWLDGDRSDGIVRRDRVCIAEIWQECLGKDLSMLDQMKSRQIAAALNKIEGWERSKSNMRIPRYGLARAWKLIQMS